MAYDNYRGRSNDSRRRDDPRGPPQRSSRPRAVTVTEPTEIQVSTNMYKYTGQDCTLYQYTVTITPEVRRTIMFDKFQRICDHNKFQENIAFDGVNTVVSNNRFDDVTLEYPLREGKMQCKIEFRNAVKMSEARENVAEVTQCLNILIRYFQRQQFYVERRKMISPSTRPTDIGTGLEVLSGLATSFQVGADGFYLNLDQSFGVFYKPQPLLEYCKDIIQSSRRYGTLDSITAECYTHLEKYLKKLRLRTNHRGEKNKTFAASGLVQENATQKVIEFEDGTKMTVAEYFAKNYKPLSHPNLPLVCFKVRNEQRIHIPIEVLDIVPMQRYSPKLNEAMTATMIKIAAKRPEDRFRIIEEKAKELHVLNNEVLDRFGIAFDNTFINCKGIMLPPPKIQYANNTIQVNNGSWNLRDVLALRPVAIENYKIFYFKSRDKPTAEQLDAFMRHCKNFGISFPAQYETQQIKSIDDFFQAQKAYFNLVVLPDRNSLRYEDIKRATETYSGHITQCIQGSNVMKLTNPAFVGNLALKINVKLGGENHCIENKIFGDKNTMIVGIDVGHPSATDVDSPTIISVVATMDYNFINYKTHIGTQERRTEIVADLKGIFTNMLKSHFHETNQKPERIIVFRDGLGDSVFDAVFSQEITAIKEACSSMEKNFSPEINFIVAQKRHSVRFSTQTKDNLVPGTFVGGLGSEACIDFFLVSAHALQGTARPTRYKVLLNESGFTQETLYNNIFGLCHLYARATKSVSIVPAIYYANLAAERGRAYLERNDNNSIEMRQVCSNVSINLFYI